ncbi:MAG: VOC family protein [Cellvibrionaceae bacterium]
MTIEHINIRVPSIIKTQHFLKAAFPDFKVRGSGSSKTYGYWSHIGNDDTYIALSQSQKPEEEKNTKVTDYQYDDKFRLMHIGYVINDIKSLIQRLSDSGYSPVDLDDLQSHPHRKRIYYFDGNGVEWEFIEYLSNNKTEKNDYSL